MQIEIIPYNPLWPSQFDLIKSHLTADLASASLPLTAIEHIGSTSIPHLPSKPIIDILIIIPQDHFTNEGLQAYSDALTWGPNQPGYHYIGTGGVRDRWSFKLNGIEPRRNVYVAAQGSLPVRSCLAFRDVLRREECAGLRVEYARVKRGLCEGREWGDVMQYSRGKDAVVRKVLGEAGWSGSMVDEKEGGCVGGWEELEVVDLGERGWERVRGYFFVVGGCWGWVRGWVMGWWRGLRCRRGEDEHEREVCKEGSEEGW